MLQSSVLPDLRVLPTEQLAPHEDVDPRRVERLSQRILEEGILKNPPVVAPIPGREQYVILDGANRVMAFAHIGVPHIVAQVVNYEEQRVALESWHHVVTNMAVGEFEGRLQQVEGIVCRDCTLEEARQALLERQIVAYVVQEQRVRRLLPSEPRPLPDIGLLRNLVLAYKGRADIIRASNDVWEKQAPCYPTIAALVVFPPLRPEDILKTVMNGEKVPSGITRHVIPERAVNINIPLGILMTDWALERKREWLAGWMRGRLAANAIRYYAESTFSFNE